MKKVSRETLFVTFPRLFLPMISLYEAHSIFDQKFIWFSFSKQSHFKIVMLYRRVQTNCVLKMTSRQLLVDIAMILINMRLLYFGIGVGVFISHRKFRSLKKIHNRLLKFVFIFVQIRLIKRSWKLYSPFWFYILPEFFACLL